MPLFDVVGRAEMDVPLQYEFTTVNEGVVSGVIVIVVDTLCAHCPAFGVNVYVVVVWLLIAGDQVPVMPLIEVVGKAGMPIPAQYGPNEPKEGMVDGVIVTLVEATALGQ